MGRHGKFLMQLEDGKIFVAGAEPLSTIQAAVNKAAASPGGAVLIPGSYTANDTYTNSSNVPILDMRGSATSTGWNVPGAFAVSGGISGVTTLSASGKVSGSSFNGVLRAVGAAAAAPITGATGGVFVTTLNVPQTAAEQTPFMVRACGYASLDIGTYTATVQPLLYASTTAGFTAAAANAVYSTAAVNVTQSSGAAAKVVPWMAQVIMWGDSVSGLTLGTKYGGMNNGALQLQSPITAIDNPPTSVNFAAAVPLQFAIGVTLSNAAATSVINLGSLTLEI